MQETQKILLEHLGNALFQVPTESEVTEAVIQEALHQSVISLLPIPEHKLYLQMIGNNLRVCYEHQQVHQMMQRNNIPYVMMKGVVSAAYYPEPMLRPLGDVDFLVREEDIPRARKVLEDAGYVASDEKNGHHISFHSGTSTLELHWQVPGLPEKHVIHKCFENIIDQGEMKDGCMQASAFHHGLILLTHSIVHLTHAGIGLRHLCDWVVFCASFTNDEFCEMYETTLKQVGLWRYAQLLAQVGACYLGAPRQEWMGTPDNKLLEQIIDDIFDSGNFGRKKPERVNHARLMTVSGENSVGKNPIQTLIQSLAHKGRLAWPVCKKVPCLLPFAMIYVGIRHFFLIAQGKRPAIHLKDSITGAQKRKAIYSQFELFKPE